MKCLAYYTIGYQSKYIDILQLSIQSLRLHNPYIDIRILCDEQFTKQVSEIFPYAEIYSRPDSSNPETASMQKLSIFHEDISKYDTVIFIDSDILIGIPLLPLLAKIDNDNQLYVYAEKEDQSAHKLLYWSLCSYNNETLDFFAANNIRVFNAGLFAFKPSNTMKTHFTNVETMIHNHSGSYFYEQSFMNVYFNKNNLTNCSIWNNDNYIMFAKNDSNPQTILHFSGSPGEGKYKLERMMSYIEHTNFFSL
jgi:alpha-N-acetylglucosamine transferase